LLLFSYSEAQNLVPNYSFEVYDTCPNGGDIQYALPWYNPTVGSPDYYNQCSFPGGASVPSSFFGFQNANTGVAYSGICVYGSDPGYPSQREYLQVGLLDTLIANKHYCVNFYVNRPDKPIIIYNAAITKIGMLFSNNPILSTSSSALNYTPQITSDSGVYLTDTVSWMLVSGTYIAQGGERFITIGNFNNDANTDTMEYPNGASHYGAYYYVDDVSIIDCTNGVNEETNKDGISVYPNPARSELGITNYELGIKEVKIYNVMGEEVISHLLLVNSNSVTLDVSGLAKGMYFVEVYFDKLSNRGAVRKKFVKE